MKTAVVFSFIALVVCAVAGKLFLAYNGFTFVKENLRDLNQ